MVNYQNGKIYKIWSPQTEQIYIGSTTKLLCQRLAKHKINYGRYKNNTYHYVSSFIILEYGDAIIELIENYPCNSKEELNKREGELIRENKAVCVNMRIAGRTKQVYREEHKEEIAERDKIYRENNKEKITERKKKYYENNKEEITEKKKQHYEEHKEEILEKQKLYNLINKEKIAERKKKHYEEHKDEIAENLKKYYEEHKEQITEKHRQLFKCKCGSELRSSDKQRHFKSQKHQKWLKDNTN